MIRPKKASEKKHSNNLSKTEKYNDLNSNWLLIGTDEKISYTLRDGGQTLSTLKTSIYRIPTERQSPIRNDPANQRRIRMRSQCTHRYVWFQNLQ